MCVLGSPGIRTMPFNNCVKLSMLILLKWKEFTYFLLKKMCYYHSYNYLICYYDQAYLLYERGSEKRVLKILAINT